MDRVNRQWVLRQRPKGLIQDGDLELIDAPIPEVKDSEVLIRTIYLSLDPTNRTWMNDAEGYLPAVQLGAVMRGLTLGVVEESRSERFKAGDIVTTAAGGWSHYAVVPDAAVSRVHRVPGLPLTANMSVMGMTGMTAWFGVMDVLQPRAGETIVISAAAGAVGSIAGQIATQKGAHVIGIAGGRNHRHLRRRRRGRLHRRPDRQGPWRPGHRHRRRAREMPLADRGPRV